MDMGHDFNLQSMLISSNDDFNFHINISDSETFTSDIGTISVSPTPLNSDPYIDEFTGHLTTRRKSNSFTSENGKIWKETTSEHPYHPKKSGPSSVVIVVDTNAKTELEGHNIVDDDQEPFDYSIFLNKPSSPVREDEDTTVEVPIQEREEVVLDQELITEEKVEELLKENQVCFGNVVPKKIEKELDGFFHCDLCSLKFNRKGNYKRHRMTHFVKSKKTPYRYQCEECSRNFLQRCDLQRHMHVHNGTYPYKCNICDNGYIRRKDLEIHLNFHRGEKTIKCTQCDKAFYSKSDLSRHVRAGHRGDEKLSCGHCAKRFSREATLLAHMQKVHNEAIVSAFKEQVCKLQQMPSVVQVDSVPFRVTSMTSPVTSAKHVVTPIELLQNAIAAKAAEMTSSLKSDGPSTSTPNETSPSQSPTAMDLTLSSVTSSPSTSRVSTVFVSPGFAVTSAMPKDITSLLRQQHQNGKMNIIPVVDLTMLVEPSTSENSMTSLLPSVTSSKAPS